MIILAMDTTAKTAAAALRDGEKLLAKDAREGAGAHSAALLPMIEDLFSRTGIGPDGIDLYAASAGPGSFTGVRIGAATLKGLAFGQKRPAAAVSALEALAYNLRDTDCTACALMDARRGQFYTALFRCGGGRAARLTPDEAKSGEEIARACTGQGALCLVGDGAETALPFFGGAAVLAPPEIRYADGESVGLAALSMYKAGKTVPAEEFRPVYLRLPQAERERLARIEKEKTNDERL